MSLVYGPLSTAFEQAYTETATTTDALSDANTELISLIDNLQTADAVKPNTGYRTIQVNITTDGSSNYSVYFDGDLHTEISPDNGQGHPSLGYDNCTADGVEMDQIGQIRLLPVNTQKIVCGLTGMVPNKLHIIEVYGDSELLCLLYTSDAADE